MARQKVPNLAKWFSSCGGWPPGPDLSVLTVGLAAGFLDEQDEDGLTALSLAVMSEWLDGAKELLDAGADTELRHFRTGNTALQMAVSYQRDQALIPMLLAGGAKADAPNHFGNTPRKHAALVGLGGLFAEVLMESIPLPEPLIQNAEHLASHYYPRFKIPDRDERETLKPGQAVSLYVYGPRVEGKQDTVKVRITARGGRRPHVRYSATVETPLEQTHLRPGETEVTFGPEHVATVWMPRPARKRK